MSKLLRVLGEDGMNELKSLIDSGKVAGPAEKVLSWLAGMWASKSVWLGAVIIAAPELIAVANEALTQLAPHLPQVVSDGVFRVLGVLTILVRVATSKSVSDKGKAVLEAVNKKAMAGTLPMLLLALMVVPMLGGCATVWNTAPTTKYCDKVNYVRDGQRIKIDMECAAPNGESVSIPGAPGL